MQYPGNPKCDAILARLRAGVRAYDEIVSLMADIEAALEAGVAFEASLALVKTYVEAIEEVIDGLRFVDLPPGWALSRYRALNAGALGRWLRMLEPAAQLRALRLLDALYARAVYELKAAECLREAERFVAEHPVPAPAVGAIPLYETLMLDESVDAAQRALPLIDLVNGWSTEPIDLLMAAQAEFLPGVHFARVLAEQDSRGRRQIENLLAFEEQVTAAYGYMYAKKAGLIFGRKERAADSETRHQLELKLIELVDGWGATPYAKRFKDYLLGRICAAHSDWSRATKLFRKALDGGFCEYMAVSQLAFILETRKKHDQARALLEEYTDRWHERRGRDSVFARSAAKGLDIGKIYANAGGDPATLGAAAPEQRFTAAAEANARRFPSAAERLARPRAEAVGAYWAECRAGVLAGLSALVQAADLDAALQGVTSNRGVRFDPALAARTHLDEVPDLAPIPRDVLLEAVAVPVSADRLAAALLSWLEGAADRGSPIEQIGRFPCVAGSVALATRRVDATCGSDWKAARQLVDAWQDAGRLPAEAVVDLQVRVLAAIGTPAARSDAGLRFLERDAAMPPAVRTPLRVAVVAALLAKLAETEAPADARTVLEAIARHATPDEARAPVAVWWSVWAPRRTPAERMQLAASLDGAVRSEPIRADGVAAALAVIAQTPVTQRIDAPLTVARALATDEAHLDAIAAWFTQGAAQAGEDALEDAADVGAWLLTALSGARAAEVTAALRGLMDRRLAAARGLAARRIALDELLERFPGDAGLQQLMVEQQAAERARRMTMIGVVLAVIGIAAIAIALL